MPQNIAPDAYEPLFEDWDRAPAQDGTTSRMQDVDAEKPADRLRLLRNGLLFGLLAGRAPRVGSIAKMKIGQQFTTRGNGFWIAFTKADMKNKRTLSYSLLAELNDAMGWYQTELRARAVNFNDHGFLWVCEDGSPFQYCGIGKMCRVESEKWLGIKMGPHRHRHNLATMMADEAPENPGAAAAVLGISEGGGRSALCPGQGA